MKQNIRARIQRWADGDPFAFRALVPSSDVIGRIRAVQINAVMRNSSPMMLANIANALTLLIAMWGTPKAGLVQAWCFFVISLSSFIFLRQREGKKRRRPQTASVRGIRNASINGLLLGSLWGLVPAALFADATSDQQLVIACLSIGMLCGGAFALSTIPVAALAFVAPIVAGSAYAIVNMGTLPSLCIAILLVVYTIVVIGAVSAHGIQLATRVLNHARDESAAHNDALTHLPNRVSFQRHLAEALARARRFGEGFAVFCFDLDNFKTVNDTMGHACGDRVLIEVARRLRLTIRDVDVVARLSGDEFAVIAAHVETEDSAAILAERINRAFEDPFDLDGKQFRCTISIGIALAPQDGRDNDILLRHADAALYATKHRERGTFTFYRDKAAAPVVKRVDDAIVRRAIADRQLQLHFQPIVEVATRRTRGFEAILRWNHPERGLLPASEIVPLAEETGLIDEIGAWSLREAVRIASGWPTHLRLAMNVSALQLRGPLLERAIGELTAGGRFAPERIELDVNEAALIGDSAGLETLQGLRRLGVRVALDDFGAGFTSMTHLLDLPIDRLKIDRSFIANVLAAPACGALVRALAVLSRDLNLSLTAEGVETAEQLTFLQNIGCDDAQGRLFSRPVMAAELEPMFESCGAKEAADLRGRLRIV